MVEVQKKKREEDSRMVEELIKVFLNMELGDRLAIPLLILAIALLIISVILLFKVIYNEWRWEKHRRANF